MTSPEVDETTARLLRSVKNAADEISETEDALRGLTALHDHLAAQLMERLIDAAGLREEE